MGMYTEVFVNADLKNGTPKSVINVLLAMCEKRSDSPALKGITFRRGYMFNNGSYYTPYTECHSLTFDCGTGRWSIIAKGDIKNYENEIEQFFEWIMPHVDAEEGEMIGYVRYEENLLPVIIVKQSTEANKEGTGQ